MTEKILKDFSRENNQEGRDALASEIREKRRDRFDKLKELEVIKKIADSNLEEGSEKLSELEKRLEYLNGNFFLKLCRFIEVVNTSKSIEKQKLKLGITKSESKKFEIELEQLSGRNGIMPEDFREAKRAIKNFYELERKKYISSEHDEYEIRQNFDLEKLKETSVEDYILLLKKFGPEVVTHVTRQGVRDHYGFFEHSVGVGESWNGFKDMLRTRDLKYNLELKVLSKEKDDAIAEYFDFENKTKEESLRSIDSFTGLDKQGFGGSYFDFHGPHYAVKYVADQFYGGESGNEIFLIYSSHAISANFFHNSDPYIENPSKMQNDVWTYVSEHQNMPLDAGITFIREDAQVDPETGSMYLIDENGRGVENMELYKRLDEIVNSDKFTQIIDSHFTKLGHIRRGATRKEDEEFEKIKSSVVDIFDGDEYIAEIFCDYNFLHIAIVYKGGNINSSEYRLAILSRMSEMGARYKKPKVTVSSKEYWEKYFLENKDQEPSKLVFYKGPDPNQALRDWMFENQINHNEEARVKLKDNFKYLSGGNLPEIVVDEMLRFRSVAYEVADRFYDKYE